MKIAIIGTGISGNSAAWLLHDHYDITIYEKNNYIGGHSNTVEIDYSGEKIAVDTGFIVFNHKTYPNLKKLFEILKVKTKESDMSFGISCQKNGLEYCVRTFRGLFCNIKNVFNPKFWRMIYDVVKFNKAATKFVKNNSSSEISLGDFLEKLNLGQYFIKYFLLPMAGAIWSCPALQMLQYPALSFLRFYHNHGLLTLFNQPKWYTVQGGSKEYVKLLTKNFKDRIKLNSRIAKVEKEGDKIAVYQEGNQKDMFDKVIFANHADEILQIAPNLPSQAQNILKNFKFQENLAILHKDQSLMPKNKLAWASWIYLQEKDNEESCCVSYWMNLLQSIDYSKPLFVTLNPKKEIVDSDIFAKFIYHHPIFDKNAIDAQSQISQIQGKDGFYYVGAYQANGFHEDGLLSAIKVAKLFGIEKL